MTVPLLHGHSPPYFFPRERGFWVIHCTAAALGAASLARPFLMRETRSTMDISFAFIWLPLFTLAVLGYRWLYKRYRLDTTPLPTLTATIVVGSAIAGAVTAAAAQAIAQPIFWDDIAANYARLKIPANYGAHLSKYMFSMAPSYGTMVLIWCVIYASVTAVRRGRQQELNNLHLQNTLKDAQLRTLSNQLNPHFLFASLNNIRCMIHQDVGRADTMITAFADILRHSLESSRQEKASLVTELEIIHKYLAIVGDRLEQRFDFQLHIAPGLDDALVPPMLLQMLVEHAIDHRLGHLHGGTLSLAGYISTAGLVLQVRTEAPAQSVTSPAPAIDVEPGLRHIAQRIDLLYGSAASFEVAHTELRFSAQLTIPMESMA